MSHTLLSISGGVGRRARAGLRFSDAAHAYILLCVFAHIRAIRALLQMYRALLPMCRAAVCCKVLQCVTVCCSVLQCVAVCCSVLQCVAVCCSVFAHIRAIRALLHMCRALVLIY